MLQSKFVPLATAILAAVMGGFGVFCAVYSSASHDVAAPAIILLSGAYALNYFCER
jgi:hypothetical protein